MLPHVCCLNERSIEMPSQEQQGIPVSSFVSKLAQAKKDGLAFVASGYIGAADHKVVRMYFDLSLETYVEIPRSAVLHAQPIKDDMHERAELMVMGNSDVNLIHQQMRTIKANELQQAMDDQKNQAMQIAPQATPPRLPTAVVPDPCAPPPTSADCGCVDPKAQRIAPSSPEEQRAERDPLRRVARWVLGPFGRLL